jgi:signal transduction histidine kinase
VQQRTQQLQTKAVQLEQEINQRKELETQLVFAQKMEAVGQLAAGIAHEVNTPSQYVCDNLRFLEEAVGDLLAAVAPDEGNGDGMEKPDAEELEFLKENAPGAVDQALQGMERITSIVKSMKNFAYRDATSEKKPQDLNQAINATIVVATAEWKYHADLEIDLDPDLPFVPCNIGEINQVVLNLIVNAAHAIKDRNPDGKKGHINVGTKQYDDCVVITIQDDGGGIPEDVQAKVFEPFFTTKEVGVGTGQGLAIAHNVVTKSHGGHLWFETELGKGSTFFIRLPLTVAQEAAGTPAAG